MDNNAATPRRSSMACTNCRYRKVKCVAPQPGARCHRCTKHDYDCQYRPVAEEEATNFRALANTLIPQAIRNSYISPSGSRTIPPDEISEFMSAQRTTDISAPTHSLEHWDTSTPSGPHAYHGDPVNHDQKGAGELVPWANSAVSYRPNIQQLHYSQSHGVNQYTMPFQQLPGAYPDPERLSLTPEVNLESGDTIGNQYYLYNPSLPVYCPAVENHYSGTKVACPCLNHPDCYTSGEHS
ncbi:hypothetical protein BD779DRAFT_377278 [Infundibulicybe gibba]|nr:hypothetical protein BD779DRAFT_377278 [Infundibulicybe gibba]